MIWGIIHKHYKHLCKNMSRRSNWDIEKLSFVRSCWCGLFKESWLTLVWKNWRYLRRRCWRQGEERRLSGVKLHWHAFIVREYGCVSAYVRGCELITLNVNRHTMRERERSRDAEREREQRDIRLSQWRRKWVNAGGGGRERGVETQRERERAERYPSESMKKKMSECRRGRERERMGGWVDTLKLMRCRNTALEKEREGGDGGREWWDMQLNWRKTQGVFPSVCHAVCMKNNTGR